MCICLLGTLGTSWMGVVSVTFPGLGTTAGVCVWGGGEQYVGNTKKKKKKKKKKNVRNIGISRVS